MKSHAKSWTVVACGDDVKAVGVEVRTAMKAYLERERATEVWCTAIRIRSPALDGKGKYELVFAVSYCVDVTLDEWLDDAMSEAIVGVGPGVMKIPKPPAKPV